MIFNEELCCGCGACVNVCPVKAIAWVQTTQGFMQPHIEQATCIDCGLCRKVCPYETNHVGNDADPAIYAAVHKDPTVVQSSSSGGVFTALSDWVLAQDGVVYGVGFDESYRLQYRRVATAAERDTLRGSKYVQADGKESFAKVACDLEAGRTVMYTGTPCQVGAMRLYLTTKKVPIDKLYLVDNICHGVASPQVWADYLAYIRDEVLKGSQITHLCMRSKKAAWQEELIDCETDAGDESATLNASASWNKLYSTTLATRESCYYCRYSSFERVGDITYADYWNIENAGLKIDYTGGVNLVLVNTAKGAEWFKACASSITCALSTKKAAWQIHLERPLMANGRRHAFWEAYASEPRNVVARYGRGSRFNAFTRKLSPILRKFGLYTLAVKTLSVVRSITNHEKKS